MQFSTLHRLAVAASLSYVPWSEATASSGVAMAAQAVGFRALSPRWAESFLDRADGAGWQIPRGGIAPNDAYGFAANLFDTPDGKLLAIRGTEVVPGSWGALASLLPRLQFGDDMRKDVTGADLDLLCRGGFAAYQSVALVNYVMRLLTPVGEFAPQWLIVTPADFGGTDWPSLPAADARTPLWSPVRTALDAPGLGLVQPGETVQVVGHSLGGHLAAIALRLFPAVFSEAALFNAPGVDGPLSLRRTEAFISDLAAGLPAPPAPDFASLGDRLLTLVAEDTAPGDDRSLVPGWLTGAGQFPPPLPLRTEMNSHSIDQIADNLALFALLESLGPSLTPTQHNGLFDAASARAAESVEATVGALATLLSGERNFPTVAAGLAGYPLDSFPARTEQLDALWRLQQIALARPELRLRSLLEHSPAELAAMATDSPAVRHALRNTTPFILTGDAALYARFVDSGPATDDPIPSLEWRDRALLFTAEIGRRLRDETGFVSYGDSLLRFSDRAQALEFLTTPLAPRAPLVAGDPDRVMFGAESPDAVGALRGGLGADRLYGGGGDDWLAGEAGADWLEGGPDQDLLLGGAGSDTLLGGAGDDVLFGHTQGADDDAAADLLCGGPGQDVICAGAGDVVLDRDGRLRVALAGEWHDISGLALRALPESGVVRLFETPWPQPLLLAFNPETRELRVGAVTVRDFVSGDLGIVLPATPPPAPLPLVAGSVAPDRLIGTAAAERIEGLSGNDLILAGGGNDEVLAGEGADRVLGDDGADLLRGEAGRDALLGGAGDDALFGGVDDDVLGGDDGRDLLAGGAGNDLLAGGPDRDVLMGADGDDLLVAGLVLGLPPDDWQVLRGAQPLTQILRDPRNVTLAQFGSIDRSQANFPTDRAGDVLYGESGADFLIGSAGEDLLDGGAGDDTGLGGDGADRLRGGDGDDHLRGSGGNDVLEGNAGDDFLAGGGTDDDGLEADGADLLDGGAGQDELQGGPGDDRLSGDSGNDRLYAGPGADWLSGGEGDDRLYGDEDADTLFGDAGADRLYGQAGDDQLIGGDDADYLDGGDGSDRLLGEAGNDRLTGGDADDQLFGGPGDDVLQGEAGADWLDGGAGSDTLLGGSGHDHYWVSDTGGLDLIIDVDGDNGLWLPDAHGLAAWRAEAAGPDLLLMRDDAGLRIRDWAHSIDWLRFGDRGMLDGAHLLQPALAGVVETLTAAGPAGTAGDDELTLRLDGGTVSAGAGNDRYVLNAGVRVQIDDARGDNTLVWPTGSSATALALEGTVTGWRLSHGDIQVDCAPGTFARYVFGNGTELSAADMLARAARELALAPRVAEAIGNRALAAGETFSFTVSDGAFVDPNPDARLSLDATLSDGRPLPYWLRFDPQTARFSGRAPAGATLSLAVTVRASDETGLSAAQQLGIDVLPPFTPGSSAVFALASLEGANGRWLEPPGAPFGPPPVPVTAVGDLNDDGFADLLFGDRLLWGSRSGVDDAPGAGSTRIEGAPDWLTGFRGVARFAAVREDCNGDGRPDLHLMPLDADGAPACLVASRAAWPATLHYAALTEVAAPADQPPDDFRDLPELLDAGAAAQIRRLARLPDFNGDGLDDFAVEALVGESARPWLAVVFGAPGAPVPLELQAPAPNRALVIECPPLVFSPHHDASSVLAASGWGPLAPLGDVNGDGLGDLGLGSAPYLFGSGSAYGAVIFGRGSGGSLSLNALDGHNGFLLAWPEPGAGYARTHAARAAGDVNGDGLDDVLLRDEATGSSAVLYGRPAFAGELLTGTAAADFLVADRAGTVSAGAGDDTVRVIAAGETTVFTGLGQNTVIVDAPDGAVVNVFGGAGADRYEVQDGAVRVLLNDPDGAPNTLKLPASFDFAQLRPGLGSVLLAAGPQAPEIHLENVDFADVLGGPRSVEVIEFADGRRLSYAALIARGFDIPGTAGPDRLVGSNVVDRLRAGAGDDRLDGGAGDDTLDGGPGNDIYRFAAGSGADLLADSGGEDLLQLDDLPAVSQLGHRQSGQDLVLVRPTGETLTLTDWYADPAARVERVAGADGVLHSLPALVNRAPEAGQLALIRATLGVPLRFTLPAGAAVDPDPFDRLQWQLKDAPVNWPAGLEFDAATASLRGVPTAAGDYAIALRAHDDYGASCSVTLRLTVAGTRTLIGSSGGDVLRGTAYNDHLLGLAGHDALRGGSGDDVLEGGEGADRLFGEAGADLLDGGGGADRLDGGAGDDRLSGESGDDWLLGATGHDTLNGGSGGDRLWGGAGDDWLDGGAGRDLLSGGAGNDRYRFDRGAGVDVIRNADAAGFDELLIDGTRRDELRFARSGDDLRLAIRGSEAQLTVQRWFAHAAARLDRIQLDDGQSLTARDVDLLVQAMARFAPATGFGSPGNFGQPPGPESMLAAVWQ